MTDSERIARLERICKGQQAVIDHHNMVLRQLLDAVGITVGTHMLGNDEMRGLQEVQRL